MKTTINDTIGLAKTGLDVHTLGISSLEDLLQESGFKTVTTDEQVSRALSNPSDANNASLIERWIKENNISVLGFSYRLNPDDGVEIFSKLMHQLAGRNVFSEDGGPIKSVYFAGLPPACEQIRYQFRNVGLFCGDESPLEVLHIMGIDTFLAPQSMIGTHGYDRALMDFGNEIIKRADYKSVGPTDRTSSLNFGKDNELLVDRINHGRANRLPPLMRAHSGPYSENRKEAILLFNSWATQLADAGLLDILSIGTSQLSQERFGQNWDGLKDGGGIPINYSSEFRQIWEAARPMLVRSYAGTHHIRELAEMYQDTINIAWHALSLWWFSEIDGRGPNTVLENLYEHFKTLEYIASTGKPYEPNVSHHFSFRGSDDVTYVVSAVLAAKAAKNIGIKDFIYQNMLNNPKNTWGINDLAKARASLYLLNELEDNNFRVYLQSRAGLNYLSHKTEKAKAQLAAVTALMDDIDPYNEHSPDIIHVVSYSEGNHLATPEVINESIQITRHALESYRDLRRKGMVDDMSSHLEVDERMRYLVFAAREVIGAVERTIKNPYTAEGLYSIFEQGFLPVPQLRYCRKRFPEAVNWQTKLRNGRVDIYDGEKPFDVTDRMSILES